jgi:lysyl-tRNA synthetase, class I
MLASAVLQTAVNAYRAAGLPDESRRARILMEEKIGESHAQMVSFETEIKIAHEDMEEFLKATVVDDPGVTLVRIAADFLPDRRKLEEEVQKTLEQAPLMALIPQKIMSDDHVAAQVGSVEDDPFGRLVRQTTMHFGLSAIWLNAALHRAIERHNLTIEHFASWANRHRLYEDLTFVIEGVRAWIEGDDIKAVHVLVPQIELGLRSIVAQLGKPVTKPHATVPGVGVAIGMGDILYSEELTQALGPDLTLHFLALYADPRGMNLRNRVAHGLIKSEVVHTNVVELLIHTLLVFGAWKEFAEKRR